MQKSANFHALQQYDSALIYADRALVLEPEESEAYGIKGEVYHFNRKYDLAIESYLKAIEYTPPGQSSWWPVGLGGSYRHKGEFLKAARCFQMKIESDQGESDARTYLYIASFFKSIGNYRKSEFYHLKNFKNKPLCWDVWNLQGGLQSQGRLKDAVQFIDTICLKVGCEQICARSEFELAMLTGEFDKAEQLFYEWKQLGNWPQRTEFLHYQIGYVYDQLEKKDMADSVFKVEISKIQSAIEEGRSTGNIHLARIYAYLGDRESAIKYLKEYAKTKFQKGWHDFILIDPMFESLRDDPEFIAIVKKDQDEKAAIRAQIREMEERGELDL